MSWTEQKLPNPHNDPIIDEVDEDDEEEFPTQPDDNQSDTPLPATTPRLTREVRALQTFNNPGRLEQTPECLFCFIIDDNEQLDETPIEFHDAWHHPNKSHKNSGATQSCSNSIE